MTTGATGQLGLALPVQGELSGTWGDTVNNGITQYTNIAIAATLTLTNDGAVTLANTTGDASASNIVSSLTGAGTVTAQFAIVRITGTLTTAKVVTAPSYSKTYTVVNAATGGIVTFKASGQTGVSIAVGESAFVYYNGTDYVKVSSTVATGVTSFTAGTTGFTPSTATTGAVTLAGTLATTNGGTGLTSFTSGGVVYASSSSALATGSALTFDGSGLTLGSNSLIVKNAVGDGNGLRIFQAASDVSSIFNFYNGSLAFGVNNTERMRLTSTGLAIGSTTANAKLNVNTTTYTAVTNSEQVLIEGTAAWQQGLAFSMWNAGTYNSGYASGYIGVPNSSSGLFISGGAAVVNDTGGSSWAKALNTTAASFMIVGNGVTVFYGNTGLTANTTYTPTERARITSTGGFVVGTATDPGNGIIADINGNVRKVPQSGSSKTSSYTLATSDIGEYILLGASGAIVIPDATFAAGDVITIFNNTASTATITCSITTAYIAGTFTDKATMTLAAAGVATVLFITSTLCVVSGNVT